MGGRRRGRQAGRIVGGEDGWLVLQGYEYYPWHIFRRTVCFVISHEIVNLPYLGLSTGKNLPKWGVVCHS